MDPTGHWAKFYDDTIGGVYQLRNVITEVIARTGRTNDLERRQDEHFRTYGEDYEFEVRYRTDVKAEQRGLEELVHNEAKAAGGGQLDKIKPIADGNKNAPVYRDAAQKYLEKLKAAEAAEEEALEAEQAFSGAGSAGSAGGGGYTPGWPGPTGGGGDGTMD